MTQDQRIKHPTVAYDFDMLLKYKFIEWIKPIAVTRAKELKKHTDLNIKVVSAYRIELE